MILIGRFPSPGMQAAKNRNKSRKRRGCKSVLNRSFLCAFGEEKGIVYETRYINCMFKYENVPQNSTFLDPLRQGYMNIAILDGQ